MTIRAWHFVGKTLRDGRPVPPDGEWLTHDGDAVMCESGLHASRHPFDALTYAPGPVLCLVECEDVVSEGDDKLVCRRRRIVARHDMSAELRAFARQCALDVAHLWDMPVVVRRYLETGDESMRAAADRAADTAAYAAAYAASYAAARTAARAAADTAGYAAARAAADAAARAAGYAAADTAARAARAAAYTAAYTAADAAARAAARAAQKTKFTVIVDAKFGVTP